QYVQMLASEIFLSERAYTALTGQPVSVEPGYVKMVFDDTGDTQGMYNPEITRLTNLVTGSVMEVTPDLDAPLCYTMLIGRYILDDTDFAEITQGLDDA